MFVFVTNNLIEIITKNITSVVTNVMLTVLLKHVFVNMFTDYYYYFNDLLCEFLLLSAL